MVVFTSQRPLERAENIKALYDAYNGDKKFVQLNWLRVSPELTSYKVMVTDEIPHEKKGTIIFITHGIEGAKRYGLDQKKPYATPLECRMIDYAICQSEKTVGLMAKQLGIPEERVLALGMPRTDLYEKKGDRDKTVYLFAPTYGSKIDIDWEKLDGMMRDDEVMIVKPHMISNFFIQDRYKHIFPASQEVPTTPYLQSCNALITDYSSIMLDGLCIRVPVVLWTKDKAYFERKGMYYDYPESFSSYTADTEEGLLETLRNAKWVDEDKREFFCGACDGHSRERIVALIRKVLYEDTYCSSNF